MYRTPPQSTQGRIEQGVQFEPPTGKLAAVTKKGNVICGKIEEKEQDIHLLESLRDEYNTKISNFAEACEQGDLSAQALEDKKTYWNIHYSSILTTRISIDKYIQSLRGTKPKIPFTTRSKQSIGSCNSAKSATSSTRIRLAEKRAELEAKRVYEERLVEIERRELETKQQRRLAQKEKSFQCEGRR